MMLISFFIILSYVILIGSFAFGFNKVHPFKDKNIIPKTRFSVIIPFRNEAKNLPQLLESINQLQYPKDLFEILLINDASEDDSADLINNFITSSAVFVKLLNNKRVSASPKKDAITTAIAEAKNEWIITTDADCILPDLWLNTFDVFIQENQVECIVAPVKYTAQNNFLNTFQILDLLSLQGATIGGFGIDKPFLCNGANFGYKKDLFKTLNGFDGNTETTSGDDIFLLEKAVKLNPKTVSYLKSDTAIVNTKAQPTWKTLISQRIRWAAKTSRYNNWFGKLTGSIVLFANLLIVLAFIFTLLETMTTKNLIYLLMIKFSIDLYLINKSAQFFNQKDVMKFYLFGFLIYPFFSVYVAIASLFSGYEWKGRKFKK
ncbi:glycosyltransferase family 2 protein [Aestuariibaculum suncheonense]|uniref:Glycosyltransferase n=1 Tax=Aestuariibaculum suncheonense TaxID=1028745 RepID=A0A8J6QDZ1_9FLAO|nr:glycosyltransferase [Aestuariibaculum suncheonense]MBD0834141.1 glycosyltransferase [Aestuariibaculum suncheonense]